MPGSIKNVRPGMFQRQPVSRRQGEQISGRRSCYKIAHVPRGGTSSGAHEERLSNDAPRDQKSSSTVDELRRQRQLNARVVGVDVRIRTIEVAPGQTVKASRGDGEWGDVETNRRRRTNKSGRQARRAQFAE